MIKVAKFGGSSVANAAQFKKVKDIIDSDNSRKFIVTSACGKSQAEDNKVTDLLYVVHAHLKYKLSADDVFSLIEEKYFNIKRELGLKIDLDKEFAKIKEDIKKISDVDYLVSRGEYLTALMLSEYLDAKFVDAKDVFVFDYSGDIDMEKTDEALHKYISSDEKIVFPGFYGAMPDGKIKVMSRGGSDITGSIIANVVNADLYENWTDVSGILVCDPRIIENPLRIDNITYSELREMSYMGANVLHDEAVFPVRAKNIPINIKNTNDPENIGTMIMESCVEVDKKKKPYDITGISGKKGFTVITCIKSHISSEVGFLRKVLSIFENYNISIESCPSSVDSISVVVDTEKIKKYLYEIISKLKDDIECDDVHVTEGISLIAVVGRAMVNKHGMSGKIFATLGENNINIKTISQGTDEICIVVGVDSKDFEKSIRCIYEKFIK
ncbi:MAG: aspartate kinase [Lachnospiraceae bacterium]|nr:aspartate kinase [Lachnospiraceae bacterium]